MASGANTRSHPIKPPLGNRSHENRREPLDITPIWMDASFGTRRARLCLVLGKR
jgi:hypothetical protein